MLCGVCGKKAGPVGNNGEMAPFYKDQMTHFKGREA